VAGGASNDFGEQLVVELRFGLLAAGSFDLRQRGSESLGSHSQLIDMTAAFRCIKQVRHTLFDCQVKSDEEGLLKSDGENERAVWTGLKVPCGERLSISHVNTTTVETTLSQVLYSRNRKCSY